MAGGGAAGRPAAVRPARRHPLLTHAAIAPIVEAMANATFRAIGNGRQLVGELRAIRQGWNDKTEARRDSSARKLADLLVRRPVVDARAGRRQ
jgi:hypothetical protein